MFTLIILGILPIISLMAAPFFLWISAKLCLPHPIRFRRAVLTLAILLPANLVLGVVFSLWATQPADQLFIGIGLPR